MGYRSNVAIAVYGEENHMVAFIAATRLKDNVAEVFNECEIYPYNSSKYASNPNTPHLMLVAQFNDVKWYNGYEDVDRWMKFVELAQKQCDYINTEFARAGEENDDNVYEEYGHDVESHLGISREVYTDLPKKQEKVV